MARITLLVGLAALVAMSCSDRVTTSTEMVFDDPSPPGDGSPFASIQEEVFGVSCALRGCHADDILPNLSAGRAYDQIVGVRSTSGLDYVAPGEPDSSYLYLKIAGAPGMRDSRMPLSGPPLPAGTIAMVREWIERGAPND